jgi:TonB family protein
MKMIKPWALACRISVVLIVAGVLAAQNSKPFPAPASSGQAIQDAAKAAVHDVHEDRPKGDALEVLSNTQGVDFRAYLQKVSTTIRNTWSLSIPPAARVRKGTVTIQFVVLSDGKIGAMKLASSSDDDLLDRIAWKAIKGAGPFSALPKAFTQPNLKLCYRFFYNEIP